MIATEARANELYEVIRGCSLCVLSQTRTRAVPGEGPLDAEVMCIGEAPGVNEDKQGRPFVGAAGQFLGELLAAARLTREQVYICNVLKCRPPGNRDPLPGEIEACAEYLDLQLDMVDPLLVVTLGRFSMSKWFPQQAISRIHGSVKEAGGRFIVPMYHPAAALHQGNLRQVLLDDFARLPAVIERARALRGLPATETREPREASEVASFRKASVADHPATSPDHHAASEPLWAEPEFAEDTEFEFDPGDEPSQSAPATPERHSAPPEVPGQPTALAAANTAASQSQLPAEQAVPAPAVKTEQIRLFE